MALVKISRGTDIQHKYTDGVSRVSVLEGAYKDATVERVSLQPGASFTYTAEEEKIHVQGGDITYTPHGSHHGSECADGEKFAYVWFELCENGYPGEIK